MKKQIPIYFETTIIDSPIQEIIPNNSNVGRIKVRAFTKYSNRNGSYISDQVADQLINSAISGNVPVVGFFDPESATWASHTGPTLANAYGYVENFLGWEPFTDTDNITRDYAVFSVVLFTEYFEEAKKILGQNQSMELDPSSITGTWATIGDEELYVYSSAKMLGFCVIGSHEPCFSVSAFFSKNDDTYKSQYEKFSSLLSDLKEQVEETILNIKGGEQTMDEFENVQPEVQVDETSTQIDETPVEQEAAPVEQFEETTNESVETENEVEPAAETVEEGPSEFEQLQQKFNALEAAYNELQTNYTSIQEQVASLEANVQQLTETNQQLEASIQTYEAREAAHEQARKNTLIEKYEKVIDEEEINRIREKVNDFSYDELESKLAIAFANKQMITGGEQNKVPLPEPQESQFALLMKKYRKN